MNNRKIAAVCYAVTALLLLLGGVMYLSRGQFMPTTPKPWAEAGAS